MRKRGGKERERERERERDEIMSTILVSLHLKEKREQANFRIVRSTTVKSLLNDLFKYSLNKSCTVTKAADSANPALFIAKHV